MALKIRMARGGAKKRPFYRIVVAENTSPRDGRFVERVGHYDPLLPQDNSERVVLKQERIEFWLARGAAPSERVALFLSQVGIIPAGDRPVRPKKSAPKKKAQERLKKEA
jgi:small subunit ribosomal protein S16